MSLYVWVGIWEKIQTAMEVGERSAGTSSIFRFPKKNSLKSPDAETVCGVELTLKELATSVSYITKLEKVRRR